MAHEIYQENGNASMMYVGEKPWHGLGTELKSPATATEAIKAANLNWKVVKKPVYAEANDAKRLIRDKYAIVREDKWDKGEGTVFGIVSENYTPLQNDEAFKFFDEIVGKKAAIYHTAGALGDGERVWILAKLPTNITVIGDDIAEKFLLLSNSHDGNSSVQIKFTPIRVVCNNTLTLALNKGPTLKVAHFKDLHTRLKEAEKLLVHKRFDHIENVFQSMAKVKMNTEKVKAYFKLVFPDPNDPEEKRSLVRVIKDRQLAEGFFEEGKGNNLPGVQGTLWAAYNGITEMVDHKLTRQTADRKLNSIWFGEGYLLKAKAYNYAEELLRV
jgi:phage/plasmid-like protein (TIGR03299 family)